MLGGEGLDEQRTGTGVDRVAEVQLSRGQVLEVLRAAAGVVGDEGVDVAEDVVGGGEHGRGRVGDGQVGAEVLDATPRPPQLVDQGLRAAGVGSPGLFGVVGRPGVQQDRRAVGDDAAGDGSADGGAPAGSGDDDDAPVQGCAHPRIIPLPGAARDGRRVRVHGDGGERWRC